MVYYIVFGLFLMFFWCPCMAINVNVQYNGGLLPDIILLTQCYLHRGTCLNAMKRFYFVFNSMFARLGTDYEIRNQWFFVIFEAMTTD